MSTIQCGTRREPNKASALIVEGPEILRRTPVIRNISIPIHYVGGSVTAVVTERLDPGHARRFYWGDWDRAVGTGFERKHLRVRVECTRYSELSLHEMSELSST